MANVGKIYSSAYVNAGDLGDGRKILVIARESIELVGPEKVEKIVLYFERAKKGLVLNATNAKVLASVWGDDSAKWVGGTVELFAEPVPFQGKIVASVKVRPVKPPPTINAAIDDDSSECESAQAIPF